MNAIHLRTEYLSDPIGIDIPQPRLFWQAGEGIRQTAFQIIAEREGILIWDSEKLVGSTMQCQYGGEPLHSRDRIAWKVRLWNEGGKPGPWSSGTFELGLLEKTDWTSAWISGNYRIRKNTRYPVDCFLKEFDAPRPIRLARLYITACGLYEATINGSKVGDVCMTPGCTDYRRRIQYQTFDATALVQSGRNRLEVQLGDGWYRGSIGTWGKQNVFGRQTKLRCQLEITYADGTKERIGSDDRFSWSNDGPLRFNDLRDGEIMDASRTPTYAGKAIVVRQTAGLSASNNVGVREKERFPATLMTTPKGSKVLDFGQNLAGFLRFSILGKAGQRLRLRMGELLEDGEFTQKNIQTMRPVREYGQLTLLLMLMGKTDKIKGELQPTPKQEIQFICSGKPDFYQTKFAVFGFRYALIETDIPIDASQFEAVAVYSDLEPTGSFHCSNPLVNRFHENTLWSMKSNFLDLPTDCPQRERLGWTGDAQIFFETAAYMMNVAPFFRKWLRDLTDNQFSNGSISAVIPYVGADLVYKTTGDSVGFGDAAILIPYRFWKRYGDATLLKTMYPAMRKYAKHIVARAGDKKAKNTPYSHYVVVRGLHLGEWLEPARFRDSKPIASRPEEATAYLHYTLKMMAEMAGFLGYRDDESLFSEYSAGAKNAYEFLIAPDGTIDTDRQAKLVRPLAMGLLREEAARNVASRLRQAVTKADYTIATGFLSTVFILRVLAEAGYEEEAFRMLENESAPGWLAEVKTGATTVWENWDGSASRNHYSPGAACQWLYEGVAGIRVTGENRFVIQPHFGGTLTGADGSYDSLYGKVSSGWKIGGGFFHLRVQIPPNTTAEILLPDGSSHAVGTGKFEFAIPLPHPEPVGK